MFAGRNSLFVKAGLALVLIWVGVWGVLKVTGAMKPTPEKFYAYVEENSLAEIDDPEERKEVISRMAEMLNGMDTEQLREMFDEARAEAEADPDSPPGPPDFIRNMTEAEQRFFMEKRMGKAFDQMMAVFNDMEREERKRIVERTLKQMRADGDRSGDLARLEEEDPEMAERIINEGLRAYYQKASAETKLDLAPVMEQMQKNLRFRRRGGGSGSNR